MIFMPQRLFRLAGQIAGSETGMARLDRPGGRDEACPVLTYNEVPVSAPARTVAGGIAEEASHDRR